MHIRFRYSVLSHITRNRKVFHRSWHEWFHRQVCVPIGVRRICICFKSRSASHCDLLLVIGKVIGLIYNLWVHAGAMLFWVISQGGQQKRTTQKLKKTNQKLMLDLKHLSLKTPNDQVPLLIFTRSLQPPPPPQAPRFTHGRGERETSDWWWNARDHGKGTEGRRSACQILCRFLGKKVVFLVRPNFWSF